jgi:tRNA(fMet)-specific endonuclease VapC
MSVLTLAELRFGADRKRSKRLHSLTDTIVASVRPVAFDENAAAAFGQLATALLDKGAPIGHMDTLIAAHALALEVVFVTNNTRQFGRVRGLRTESWAKG